MKSKSVAMVVLALFLFHAQAMASIPNESEILASKAQRSTSPHKGQAKQKRPAAKPPSNDQVTEEISAADREREILSGKAQRSVPIKKKNKKRTKPAVEAEASKSGETTQSPVSSQGKNTASTLSAAENTPSASDEDSSPTAAADASDKTSKEEPISADESQSVAEWENNPDAIEPSGPTASPASQEPAAAARDAEQIPDKEKEAEQVKPSDDEKDAAKAKKPARKVSAADWEREILSGKAQRSTPMR